MERSMEPQEYYLGLDIGTNSVGYAVTDTEYKLRKYKGEPMWGVHTFESAATSLDRRGFRTARRRIDRRQQRVLLTQELFAQEISKVDPDFFTRIAESALCREDRTTDAVFFQGQRDPAIQYYKRYPTIHHLICELMESNAPHDVRLVYLAVAYLMAHRGHFLKEIDKNNINAVLDFSLVYRDFLELFMSNGFPNPWECEPTAFADILKSPVGIKEKNARFRQLLYCGKKPVEPEDLPYSCASMLNLLSGGKEALSKLYCNDALKDLGSISLSAKDDDFEEKLEALGDDAALLIQLKSLYDWSILVDLLYGHQCKAEIYDRYGMPPFGTERKQYISRSKVEIYAQHKHDLAYLKAFIRKYCPEQYSQVFRRGKKDTANYVAYSYNTKSLRERERDEVKKKATQDDFCDYIRKLVKDRKVESADQAEYDDMMERLQKHTFMPKQVSSDNRVIPYQLYWAELNQLLKNAEAYLPFLAGKDSEGRSVTEKLLSIFEFRIPYYVGPLRKDNSPFAWIQRKAEGRIYPWNFDALVDQDASEIAFINRMTRSCTYLPGETVLPKRSLLYQEFEVLNELNNLRIDGCAIPPALKAELMDELFKKKKTVTVRQIKGFLASKGFTGELSGLDTTVKASLSSYLAFRRLLEQGALSTQQAEQIIERFTYTESRSRAARWLAGAFPSLSKEDQTYLLNLKFQDFGRLSRRFLTGICETDPSTGASVSIIDALRSTQENLMQLLSGSHSYQSLVDAFRKTYYQENPATLAERLEELYIPSAVRRPIIRTLDIVADVQKVCGAPKAIFVEMARGGTPQQKGKRTQNRRSLILEFYKNYPAEEVRALSQQLQGKEDRELQSEALYLYFIQLGKCMYSGQPLDIDALKTDAYNIDHIYPRSKVKDDSLDNKVLVLSDRNGAKSDRYPISADIRAQMHTFWHALHEKGLISDEKWRRLTRSTPFTADEKWGFINRQLVETRQSAKVIAALLKERFPNSEICYVKAGLAADYRQEYQLLKARSVNDLHHAKDAYLNIVVGNVWHNLFSRRWFNIDNDDYSIKVKTLFDREHRCGGSVIWHGAESNAMVKTVLGKNSVHLTRYAFCRHGGFFDQQPVRAADNPALIPRKAGLPAAKYGGYAKTTASFFSLVKYRNGKKADLMVMPVELLAADRFRRDPDFAAQYARTTISQAINKQVTDVEFPLGKRELKINTVFSFDGFRICLGGKNNKGLSFTFYAQESLAADRIKENYIKRLEAFSEKRKAAPGLCIQAAYDKITQEENLALYRYYQEKSGVFPFKVFWAKLNTTLQDADRRFSQLPLETQVEALLRIGAVLKSNRSGDLDLRALGDVEHSSKCIVPSRASGWKQFHDVRILDVSASGLFTASSENLLELL